MVIEKEIVPVYTKDGEKHFNHAVTGQAVTGLCWKRIGSDYTLGKSSLSVVWLLNRLPREDVGASPLKVFKAKLDGVLSNLV